MIYGIALITMADKVRCGPDQTAPGIPIENCRKVAKFTQRTVVHTGNGGTVRH